jgi:hypothetical protein
LRASDRSGAVLDGSRYSQDIAAFLRAHAPPGIPNNGEGQLSTAGGQMISYDVIDAERGNSKDSPAELDITVAALGAGMAGIRADAEVVPAGATCAYSGGPAPVPAPAAHGNSVAGSSRLSSRPPKSPPPRSRANVTCYGTCLPAMATFVLIHGAGDAGWYWHLTEAELHAGGHHTIAPDLPCDNDAASLNDYARTIIDAMAGRTR